LGENYYGCWNLLGFLGSNEKKNLLFSAKGKLHVIKIFWPRVTHIRKGKRGPKPSGIGHLISHAEGFFQKKKKLHNGERTTIKQYRKENFVYNPPYY